MTAVTRDWLLEPVPITSVEGALLYAAARSDQALHCSIDDLQAFLALTLAADRGLLRWVNEGGWPKGYLTCPGWNALWRHYDNTHIDDCGAAWLPEGVCTGCRMPRRLDRAAWLARLTILDPDERAAETAHSALWCPEHGYVRAADRTTTKVCRLPGTPLHDGGLKRVSP